MSQSHPKIQPEHHPPGLLRAPLLYNQTSESAKTFHKNDDLQHEAELLGVFPSESSPEGLRAPDFVLPRFSDANGAEEQIDQEFNSVFVYWVQTSRSLHSLRCSA